MNVVDSPPGTTRPSSPSSSDGFRTSRTSAPSRRSIAACSRKFPWTASTPIRTPEMLVARRFLEDGVKPRERAPEQAAHPAPAAQREQQRVDRAEPLRHGGENHPAPPFRGRDFPEDLAAR